MPRLERYLRTCTSVSAMTVSMASTLTLGILLMLRQPAVLRILPWLLGTVCAVQLAAELIGLFASRRGRGKPLPHLLRATAYGLLAGLLWRYPGLMWYLLSIGLAVYALMQAIASGISFWQYRQERSAAPFRYLLGAVMELSFACLFFLSRGGSKQYPVLFLGIYLILYAAGTLLDLLDELLPDRFRELIQRRLRIPLPLPLATFVPIRALKAVNRYYRETPDAPVLSSRKDGELANVEIFIHMARRGANAIGHVDIVVDGSLYSYGGYDERSARLFGGVGPGVLFVLQDTESYIRMSTLLPQSILIAYGLNLTEAEMESLRTKLREILSRTVEYKPDAQLVEEGLLEKRRCRDYCSKLYTQAGARFFKFTSGLYKHYWVLGTNCAVLVDDLLGAAGKGHIASLIIAPGSYYTYLDREFARPNSAVVYRRVYRKGRR